MLAGYRRQLPRQLTLDVSVIWREYKHRPAQVEVNGIYDGNGQLLVGGNELAWLGASVVQFANSEVGGGAGQVEHGEGERERDEPVAERGDQLAEPQQPELAIPQHGEALGVGGHRVPHELGQPRVLVEVADRHLGVAGPDPGDQLSRVQAAAAVVEEVGAGIEVPLAPASSRHNGTCRFASSGNAALPNAALANQTAWDNPMGTDGFEFVEYASTEPKQLGELFEQMGFSAVARHRSRDVTLYRQGDVNAGGDVLAMNFLMDRDAEKWRRELADLRKKVGECDTSATVKPKGALAGEFIWRCAHGRVSGSVLLAPTRPSRIQGIKLEVKAP